jgi:hypothetical protein
MSSEAKPSHGYNHVQVSLRSKSTMSKYSNVRSKGFSVSRGQGDPWSVIQQFGGSWSKITYSINADCTSRNRNQNLFFVSFGLVMSLTM